MKVCARYVAIYLSESVGHGHVPRKSTYPDLPIFDMAVARNGAWSMSSRVGVSYRTIQDDVQLLPMRSMTAREKTQSRELSPNTL